MKHFPGKHSPRALKRDDVYFTLPTEATWTNQTFSDALCAMDASTTVLSVEPRENSDRTMFLLPECFYDFNGTLHSITLENIVISGNVSVQADPLLRFPTNLTYLGLDNVHLVNPSKKYGSSGYPYAINWVNFFDSNPLLGRFDITSSGLTGSLPKSMPAAILGMDLSNNSLSGSIPATLLSNATALADAVSITIVGNKLSGSIPATLLQALTQTATNVSSIYLNVGANQLSGTVPKTLLDFSSAPLLTTISLYFRSNQLTGSVTSDFFTKSALTVLEVMTADFGQNRLSGTIAPSLFSNLPAASPLVALSLYLDSNQLSGSIPNLWTGLTAANTSLTTVHFDLSSNKLSGSLPATLMPDYALGFNVTNEIGWWLGSNALTGTVPTGLIGTEYPYSMHRIIDLHGNKLSGTIPTIRGNASLIWLELSLASNSFSGTIPATLISQLPSKLQILELDLSNNAFGGSITEAFFEPFTVNATTDTRILYLGLAKCGLSGTIPSNMLGSLSTLQVSLDNNAFTGTVPSSLFVNDSLTSQFSLSAVNNKLSGGLSFPALSPSYTASLNLSRNKLTNLTVDDSATYVLAFDVSYNTALTGTIPAIWFSNDSTLVALNAAHTSISGPFPNTSGFIEAPLRTLDLSYTAIDFCAYNRSIWTIVSLSSCSLVHTNASSCTVEYPSICDTQASDVSAAVASAPSFFAFFMTLLALSLLL